MANQLSAAGEIANIGANVVNVLQMRKNNELRKGELDVAQERNKILKRQSDVEYGQEGGPPGLAQQRVNTAAQQIPVQDKYFGRTQVTMFEGALKQRDLDKAFSPILDSMKSLADNPTFNNRQVYMHYKANWPLYKKALLDNLQKEAINQADKNPAQAQLLTEIMGQIEQDQTGALIDQAMPGTAQGLATESAAITAKTKTTPFAQTEAGIKLKGKLDKEKAQITAGTKESKTDKELKDLASKMNSIWNDAARKAAGQDITSEALGEKSGEVADQQYARALTIAKQYYEKSNGKVPPGMEKIEKDGAVFIGDRAAGKWIQVK